MKYVGLVLALLALTACGSKEDASNRNFSSALEQYVEKNPELCTGYGGFRWSDDMEKSLEKLGLFTGGALTDSGQKFFRKKGEVGRFMGGQVRQTGDLYHVQFLCYGKVSLDKVVKWDAPSSNFTRVYFTYHVNDLADWAKDKDIQAAFQILKDTIDGDGNKTLVANAKLTSEGWEIVGF